MKTFISFTFSQKIVIPHGSDAPDEIQFEQGYGRIIIQGVPDSTAKLEAIEQAIKDQMKSEEQPTIIGMTIIPDSKPNGRILQARR